MMIYAKKTPASPAAVSVTLGSIRSFDCLSQALTGSRASQGRLCGQSCRFINAIKRQLSVRIDQSNALTSSASSLK